jgi:L-alanine-DL-glutamate epimerase-like enolase superfamily enzyme
VDAGNGPADYSPQLKELGVELVEQPLAKDNWEDMRKLYVKSPLPLFADEACVFENDVEKCSNHFHGINIKLTKCSGITPALRMIKKARELDLKIMVGCMNESTIGFSSYLHTCFHLSIMLIWTARCYWKKMWPQV